MACSPAGLSVRGGDELDIRLIHAAARRSGEMTMAQRKGPGTPDRMVEFDRDRPYHGCEHQGHYQGCRHLEQCLGSTFAVHDVYITRLKRGSPAASSSADSNVARSGASVRHDDDVSLPCETRSQGRSIITDR